MPCLFHYLCSLFFKVSLRMLIVQLFTLKVKLDFKVSRVPVFTSVTVDAGF